MQWFILNANLKIYKFGVKPKMSCIGSVLTALVVENVNLNNYLMIRINSLLLILILQITFHYVISAVFWMLITDSASSVISIAKKYLPYQSLPTHNL